MNAQTATEPGDAAPASPDTPRTNAVWQQHRSLSPQSAADAYELAQTLERELAACAGLKDALAEARAFLESLEGEIICDDADGNRYAGPFRDETSARAWLALQPNRRHLYLFRITQHPLP